MNAKVYLKIECEVVKQPILLSYAVNYVKNVPHLGENKCEFYGCMECGDCPIKQKRRNAVYDHFEDQYKNIPLLFVVEADNEDVEYK